MAIIETKNRAMAVVSKLEEQLDIPNKVRMHWTGCPNSCAQARARALAGRVVREARGSCWGLLRSCKLPLRDALPPARVWGACKGRASAPLGGARPWVERFRMCRERGHLADGRGCPEQRERAGAQAQAHAGDIGLMCEAVQSSGSELGRRRRRKSGTSA